MTDSISSACQRTRAQTAAYLLGIRPELPDIIDTAEQYQAPAGEVDKSKLWMQLDSGGDAHGYASWIPSAITHYG